MNKIPQRFIWAAEVVSAQQGDTILEIGCGAGLLIEQLADRIKKGKIIAVDRSASMAEKARKRNERFLNNGTVEVIVADFGEIAFDTKFETIVAFNVNFFLKNGSKEMKLIKQAFKSSGRLYVFYQAPYEIDITVTKPIIQQMEDHGFTVVKTLIEKIEPTSAVCVIAQFKM